MRFDVLASSPQVVDHLGPLFVALPDEHRGVFVVRASAARGVRFARERAEQFGISITARLPKGRNPLLIGCRMDYRHSDRDCVYAGHGVGQCLRGDDGALLEAHDAHRMPRVYLHLAAGPHAELGFGSMNPGVACAVTGPIKLDAWLRRASPVRARPLVVLSTHWDARVVPETRTAFSHFARALPALRKHPEFDLALHAHPLIAGDVQAFARRHAIPFFSTFEEVLRDAHAYVTDCSSTLYEFAYLNRPVVVLNAPWYRRDHHHGLRFWEAAHVGVQVDEPEELEAGILTALADAPERQAARADALAFAYPPADGHATERAITALLTHAPGH